MWLQAGEDGAGVEGEGEEEDEGGSEKVGLEARSDLVFVLLLDDVFAEVYVVGRWDGLLGR